MEGILRIPKTIKPAVEMALLMIHERTDADAAYKTAAKRYGVDAKTVRKYVEARKESEGNA